MEQSRPKRGKTSATRVRRREVGSPSTRDRGDPYYSLICKKTRMAKFQGRKPTYIRYVDLTWLAEQNFSFPHDMEAQGTIQFMELKGQVYPALVREFYANFRYKDGKYCIGDCSWVKENFDPTEVYKSFLRGPHLYIQGQLTKAGLLHYIIAYILVQRNTNHAQPTVNDLRFMYAVKNNVMINWPEEILKIMNSVSLSQSKLLPYSIFISRIVDYLRIDVSDTIIVEYTDKDHLVGESLIHKMGNIQLEAMEQRLNNRMDLHFQGLKDSYFAGMEQYEERQTAYSDNQFRELRNLIQSTAEAQNALSYLCLSGEIRTLSFLLITLTILILHLNLSLEDFRPRISYL
ncbi:hypothetical protein Lal_00044326, partial [Lupinus albus]